jgi:hypothetical protein
VEKIPIHFFSTFGSKINEFERKKIGSKQKIANTTTLTSNSPIISNISHGKSK